MDSRQLADVLWYGGIAVDAVLVARLWRLRLVRRYPVLLAFGVVGLVRGTLLVYLRFSDSRLLGLKAYALAYVVSQPLEWALFFLLVLEFYSRMLEDFPGIRRLGGLAMYSALASIAGGVCLLVALDQQAGFHPYPFLSYLAQQQRGVYLALCAIMLFLLLFVAHFRLSISRNVWILCACFGGHFLASSALLTLREHYGVAFVFWRNLLQPLSYLVALLVGVLFVTRAGEQQSYPISALWGRTSPELEAALAMRLQGFNQVLVKALRS